MAIFFRHTLFLFVLAAICYALAIFVTGGRVAFIAFFVVRNRLAPVFRYAGEIATVWSLAISRVCIGTSYQCV